MNRTERLIQDILAAFQGSPTPIPRIRALVNAFEWEISQEDSDIYRIESGKMVKMRARRERERERES